MTNVRNFFSISLLAFLSIALAGCNKDDESALFSIIGNTSLDFEYNQTKEVRYRAEGIKRFEGVRTPDGWDCVHVGDHYVITSPAENDPYAEMSGTIEVSCTSNTDVIFTRKIAVAVRIAEQIVEPANSYIVSEPGKRFKFNALRRGNETAETLRGTATGVLLMWTTSTTAIRNISFEDGYIYFATGGSADDTSTFEEANAVIAATDRNGKVLWSWHIWATAEDPTRTTYNLGGEWVMDRNLGAFAASGATADDAWRSYGLYYQWGRKDPFAGPKSWDSTTTQILYNAGGGIGTYSFEVSSKETGTIEFAIANSVFFIAGAEGNDFDWLYATHDNSLWGTTKTIHDPCPAGWKVAPATVWATFDMDTTVGGYDYGWTFEAPVQAVTPGGDDADPTEGIFFPAAGRRSFSPTLASAEKNFTNVVNDENGVGYPVGFYWSSTGGSLGFDHSNVDNASSNHRAGGFPVRCVAE